MSDVDSKMTVKFTREKEVLLAKRKKLKSGIDEFSLAIARIAVAQICENLGFQSVQESALNALADVGIRYIKEVGRTASFYSYLGNRCQCNLLDLVHGLENLGSIQGFSGASDLNHALLESGVIKDISFYVSQEEEIPFAYLIPAFPTAKKRRPDPSFAQMEENSPDEHIPRWLPRFPDPETYMNLNPLCENSMETLVENKIPRVDDSSRKAERSLMTLQQNWGFGTDTALELGNVTKYREPAESNPFLASPILFGDKEVSLTLLPAKPVEEATRLNKKNEIIETGASTPVPSLSADKAASSGFCEPEDMSKMLLPERPTVHFKFESGKNSVFIDQNLYKAGKISPWFSNE